MGIRMDEALNQAALPALADRCSKELQRHRRREPADDRYCLEILRRAIVQQVDLAWSMVQQCFGQVVRIWLHSHPSTDIAPLHHPDEHPTAPPSSRSWY